MNILVIGRTIPEKSTGLIGLFEFAQAKALKLAGNTVIYGFTDNRSIKELRKIKQLNTTIDGVPVRGTFFPIGGLSKKLFDQIKYQIFRRMVDKILTQYGELDVIHVHFPLLTLNESIIHYLNSLGVKVIITEHWTKVQKKALSLREEKILSQLYLNFNHFIAVSDLLANSLLDYGEQFKLDKDLNIQIIPNLIDSSFEYQPRKPSEEFVFVTIGRLTDIKANNLVIEAFAKVLPHIPNSKLIIIGDGKEKAKLERLVDYLQLKNNVSFTGFMTSDEIAKLFRKIDVYVTASQVETFGVPVVEAWLAGRPVVIGDHHPLSDKVTQENGVLYRYANERKDKLVEYLAEAMLKANQQAYDYEAIAIANRDYYATSNIIAKLLQIYQQ